MTTRQEEVSAAGLITREKMTCSSGLSYGNPCGSTSPRTTLNRYNRLGMLVRQQINSAVDSMGYDESGNMLFRRNGTHGKLHSFTITASPASNRMASDTVNQMNFLYTADGARDQEYSSSSAYSTRFFYYDGLGRMTGSWHFVNVGGSPQPHNNSTDCLFDAEGQMSKPCDNGAPWLAYDGNNVVATPLAATNGPTWRFVHGPGLDDPLLGWWRGGNGAQKVYYYVTDGQGRHLAFADSTGWLGSDDYNIRYGDHGGKYAGGTSSASSFNADRFSSPEMPGLSFFRNRAYDQNTGRWTQEDPIGVAGGLNLYQFNNNNPVMFSDPFGLWPSVASIWGPKIAQSIIAVNAFVHNFRELRRGNGPDHFRHCVANCESTKAGTTGEKVAELLSDLKEAFDQTFDGGTIEESARDQEANEYGREGAKENPDEPCSNICAKRYPEKRREKRGT